MSVMWCVVVGGIWSVRRQERPAGMSSPAGSGIIHQAVAR